MKDTLHDRIEQRLKIMGLSAQRASLDAGLSRDVIRKLLSNRDQLPTGKTLSGLARALDVSEQWLLTGADGPVLRPQADVRNAAVPLPNRLDMPNDVPVRGTAAGSLTKGAFQITSDVIDYVRRPHSLIGASDIYGLYIEGSSMEPQYFPGDLVYVHPHRPARAGDVVIVQTALDEFQGEASIGVYVKRTEKYLTILKRNPPNTEVQISRETIRHVHKVLSMNEIFGV